MGWRRLHHSKHDRNIGDPKSGWEGAWQRLTDVGILVLPDASKVDCITYITDGIGYVVEVHTNSTYRTYMYDNPQHAPCEDGKKMMRIGEIIAEEIRLSLNLGFQISSLGRAKPGDSPSIS